MAGDDGVLHQQHVQSRMHHVQWDVFVDDSLSTGTVATLPKPYSDHFFAELRKYLPHLKFAKFLGGEPFLAQESYRIWDMMVEDKLQIPCHVTTNGTQWNERVERVLEHVPCSFSISMDGVTKKDRREHPGQRAVRSGA